MPPPSLIFRRGSPPFAKAGMLSPEDSRLLAQAEAVELANRGMASVQQRLEARFEEIEQEAAQGQRSLQ
jgi:hypothetical protein